MNNHNMDGMTNMPPPTTTMQHHHTMMHMTFFWGKHGEILFPGWPGTNKGMYALVLIFVFFLSFFVEFLSHVKFDSKKGSGGPVIEGLVRTLVHGLRVGLAYMVMLAVMSFNGGVFLVAVAGHALGFFVFGTLVFKKGQPIDDKHSDLSPMICAA